MQIDRNALTREKANGRFYTPLHIVKDILSLAGYSGGAVLRKHVIDNSCGDGAFLVEIVETYCRAAMEAGEDAERIRSELGTYVHGIEIDEVECEKCRANVSGAAARYGVSDVDWDILCADALKTHRYDGKMDFVLGNPPYIRVHHLFDHYDTVKQYRFARDGMTDAYIVFYEIGLSMLRDSGVLGYITPSSLFNSVAGGVLRAHLSENRRIRKVVDLKHFQPFSSTTYTTIMILSGHAAEEAVEYYEYDGQRMTPVLTARLTYEDFYCNGMFYFGRKTQLETLHSILLCRPSGAFAVKNGFATLCDRFFIGNWAFRAYTIPVVKASTGNRARCLYPYDREGRLIPYEALIRDPDVRAHYEKYGPMLRARSLEKESAWYGFGRSQGVKDVYKRKYAVNTLLRNPDDIRLVCCEAGTGVYSGLYILTDMAQDELEAMLRTDAFISYVAMLGKYKSGGYYTFSSKDLQRYLDYRYAERSGKK